MQRYRHTDVEAFSAKLKGRLPTPTHDEQQKSDVLQLLAAFADGRFADALPYPYYDHLLTWMKEQISDGNSDLVVCLQTVAGGLVCFLYQVTAAPDGLITGPAVEFSVPSDEDDTDIDQTMLGCPAIVVDVGSLHGTPKTALAE